MKSNFLAIYLFIFGQILWAQQDIFRTEPERINNLVHTKLKVSFDFDKEQMPGEAWITLTPHFYPTDSLTLDAKGMLIHEVAMHQNNKNSELKYNYNNDLLKIQLGKTFSKKQEYTIYIKYTARPNEVKQQGSAAIADAKGLYFINPRGDEPNKPTQIWTQGETEASSCWFPTIDKPNQKTTEEIYITVPDRFVTLSNGTLISQNQNSDGSRTDYWKQTQKHAPYLFYMGIGEFAVVKDNWKGKAVDYYVEHEYAPFAREIFGMTPDMITFFSQKFGYEYPWDKYAQMVCRDYISGAMENTTAVIHMDRAQQKRGQLIDENVWEDVIAHELAHHWFGNLVTTESWSNLTLNESFANYSEYLWREHRYGKASADEHRLNDLQIYFSGNLFDKNLVRHYYHAHEDMFDAVSYNKGGYVLHMLRSFLGDEAFFAGLNKFLKNHEYGKAEAHELRLALEDVSGKDLNGFFNQWFFGNGHPKITVLTENSSSQVTVNLRQTQTPLFEFPIQIDVYENGKATRHRVWAKKQAVNTFRFSVKSKPELVVVNADNDLLAEITHDLSVEENAKLYQYATDEYTHQIQALEALSTHQLAHPLALKIMTDALSNPNASIRKQAIQMIDITSEKVQAAALQKIENLAQNDPQTRVQAAAMEALSQLKNNKYLPIFEKALNSESFSVQGNALNALMSIDSSKALSKANQVEKEVLAYATDLVVTLIPQWKAANDTSYFEIMTELAAFYAFMPFQKPEYAKPAEDAFVWIMQSDSFAATTQIMQLHQQVYKQLKDTQPMALPFLTNMTKRALTLKSEAARANPSPSMEKQVNLISKTIEKMK
ncbi:MAG: M1 family metallopeptidase [Flavobacteriaceae bacterium]|nr:M1 family metallopeptidase [Flavobacteriaceae bacterium]